jgi:hypothetical protein
VMLTFRQPRLQYGQGIHNFFCQHQRLRGDACRNRMKRPRGDARSCRESVSTRPEPLPL